MTSSNADHPDEPLLGGFTVVDFTRVLAGPYCTRLLLNGGAIERRPRVGMVVHPIKDRHERVAALHAQRAVDIAG